MSDSPLSDSERESRATARSATPASADRAAPASLSLLSVVIPARDEAGCIASTVEHLHLELALHSIPHEIVVVDDGSTDATWQILEATSEKIPELVPVKNPGPHGFGRAIQKGLATASGDAMVIMMADESDDCRDVVRLNDTTNAFKAYRREVIEGCLPILSPHFNITVELPLKAIVRGYSWKVIPITWRNRRSGVAKLKIREMGSRYFFIVAYVWLEKYFSRGDYRRATRPVS